MWNEKQNIRERKAILTTEWARPEIVLLEYIGCDIKKISLIYSSHKKRTV